MRNCVWQRKLSPRDLKRRLPYTKDTRREARFVSSIAWSSQQTFVPVNCWESQQDMHSLSSIDCRHRLQLSVDLEECHLDLACARRFSRFGNEKCPVVGRGCFALNISITLVQKGLIKSLKNTFIGEKQKSATPHDYRQQIRRGFATGHSFLTTLYWKFGTSAPRSNQNERKSAELLVRKLYSAEQPAHCDLLRLRR